MLGKGAGLTPHWLPRVGGWQKGARPGTVVGQEPWEGGGAGGTPPEAPVLHGADRHH